MVSWLLIVIVALVFAADQKTKTMVERRIPARAVVPVIPGLFNLINTQNSGAVFGVFNDSSAWWKTPLLIGVSITLLVVVVALVLKTPKLHWTTDVGLALVLGGALSNLYDRIRAGKVEDFLDFYFRSYHWAAFNVADSAIVVGTALIILQVLFAG